MRAKAGAAVTDATPVRHSALRSSLGLVAGKAAQTGAGFAFWIVAARATSDREVGLTTAAVSAVMICTQLAVLGAGSAVIVAVGRGEQPARVLDAAFAIVGVAGTVLALGYLALQSAVAPDTASVSVLFWLTFLVAAVTGTLVIVLDQALVALGRGASATSRYVLGGAVSLGAAAAVALWAHGAPDDVLLACWTLGSAVACIVGAVQLRKLVGYRPRPSLRLARGRSLLALGFPNQLLTLTERTPGLVLPLLLAHTVAPEAAAYWYPAWMMAWAAYPAPTLMGIVQFSEGVRDADRLVPTTWASLRWSLGCRRPGGRRPYPPRPPAAQPAGGAVRRLVRRSSAVVGGRACAVRGTAGLQRRVPGPGPLHGGDRGRRDARSRTLRFSAVGR